MNKNAKINDGQPDPIQNRRLSNACWNGAHMGSPASCSGWLEACESCQRRSCREGGKGCACGCHDQCECSCHSAVNRRKVSRKSQQAETMDIMESGCGTIEVK
jgi:hypothetical protein